MRFRLHEYFGAYAPTTFVETGTHIGDAVVEAMAHPFRQIHSVDTNAADIAEARRRVGNDSRAHLTVGRSDEFLRTLLPQLKGERILYWLDAHFPSDDEQTLPHDDTRLPLFQELSIIKELRGGEYDVIGIDDIHLYDERIQADSRPAYWGRGLAPFLHQHFSTTHQEIVVPEVGYLILVPK
jgi:hypothetical protein